MAAERSNAAMLARGAAIAAPCSLVIGLLAGLALGRPAFLWAGMLMTFVLACVAAVLGRIAWGGKDMRVSPIGIVAAAIVLAGLVALVAYARAWADWTF